MESRCLCFAWPSTGSMASTSCWEARSRTGPCTISAPHLASQLRSSDIVARIDDERIIILLPRARIQGALYVAQKMCRSVETTSSLLPELPCLTISIGVAEYPASAQNVEGLLDAADAALGQAKDQGRNRAVAAPALTTPERVNRPSLAG